MLSLTGTNADHRLRIPTGSVAVAALALKEAIEQSEGEAGEILDELEEFVGDLNKDSEEPRSGAKAKQTQPSGCARVWGSGALSQARRKHAGRGSYRQQRKCIWLRLASMPSSKHWRNRSAAGA